MSTYTKMSRRDFVREGFCPYTKKINMSCTAYAQARKGFPYRMVQCQTKKALSSYAA